MVAPVCVIELEVTVEITGPAAGDVGITEAGTTANWALPDTFGSVILMAART
jgi:hypothetical protein